MTQRKTPMSSNKLIYNKIDFVVKAPKFRIAFSYTDDKGLSFVREYILRLLNISPCPIEKLCAYFDFSQNEMQIALDDLLDKDWVKLNQEGLISLSQMGQSLFKHNSENTPILPTLKEKSVDCYMELIGENFIKNNQVGNNRYAIEMVASHEIIADSKNVVRKNFQNRFLELQEEDFFELNVIPENNQSNPSENQSENFKGQLYQIDDVNDFGTYYFRFCQEFSLDTTTGKQSDRNDIEIKHSEKLTQSVTKFVSEHQYADNMRELRNSIEALEDECTLKMLVSGFDNDYFNKLNEKLVNTTYFVGQIYHQNEIKDQFTNLIDKLKKNPPQRPKKLHWFGVSNDYWGSQEDIRNMLELFNYNNTSKHNGEKYRLYDFRLYLPLDQSDDYRAKNQWLYRFRDNYLKSVLYGFKTGLLSDNTEILILEDEFVAVCYHAKLKDFDVTFPIGFYSSEHSIVQHIFNLTQSYLNQSIYDDKEKSEVQDFGKLEHFKQDK